MAATTFSPADSALISSLVTLSDKSPKLVRWSDYPAPADPKITVRSWKMNEFKYYDVPSPFPTLARGLFSCKLPRRGDEKERYRIVARGYDKFFNIGEVPWTSWRALEAHTAAPYTLTLKSNGCIIFLAALTPTKLLITSKHSIGPVAGTSMSHAEAGEGWLRKYLEAKGRKEEDLAAVLWQKNLTAVAELCDDSFEEHVLPYPPHLTGLHLHGLNRSSAAFDTLDQSEVDAFAEEWGFIRTRSVVLPSIAEVQRFTTEVGKTGKWDGEAVEGFVVRCRVSDPPTEGMKTANRDRSPYSAGSSFFFKIKFDEPYMMYRDWREITKTLISKFTKQSDAQLSLATSTTAALAVLPKAKLKRPATRRYAEWVCEELKADLKGRGGKLGPKFASYNSGKGIIATRERFLAHLAAKGETLDSVVVVDAGELKKFGKTVIVPIAIPGCGKTAVSVALAHIFGFGHTQSDDVKAKKAAPAFIKNVKKLLETKDVVIADKNNHLHQHRQGLREATTPIHPPVRLLALDWNHALFPTPTSANPNPLSRTAIHRLASARIVDRGSNHQSLTADTSVQRSHEDVVWKFIEQAEDLSEGESDAVVEMNIEDGMEQAVERAVDGVCKELGLPRPAKEVIAAGVDKARAYVPGTTQKVDANKSSKSEPRYFAILPEMDVCLVVGERLAAEGSPDGAKTLWDHLMKNDRITPRPHITVAHKNTQAEEQELWDACSNLDRLGLERTLPLFWIRFSHLLWDERVMALAVDDFGVQVEGGGGGGDASEDVNGLMSSIKGAVKERLHVTVGTVTDNVPPFEAKALVEAWKRGEETSPGPSGGNIGHLSLVESAGEGQGIVVLGRLRGMFK